MMLVLQTLFAGAVGTAGMTVVMTLLHRKGWAHADMIRVLGSLLTRKYENALWPGLALHFTAGALFAIPYAIVLSLQLLPSTFGAAAIGAILGLLHGILASIILLAVVSGSHPVERFRNAGVDVAIAYIAGHIAYGMIVCGVVSLLGLSWHGVL